MNNQLEKLLNKSKKLDVSRLSHIKNCVLIAPHPDDESLGCGALIASLREKDINVHVIFTTDGSMSHPHSKTTTAIGRVKMREQEAIKALAILGVAEQNIVFLRGTDSALPAEGETGFTIFVELMKDLIDDIKPELVLVPYELDPHRDHRASWQMTIQALREHPEVQIWQYLIWLYTLGKEQDVEPLTNIPGGIQYFPVSNHLASKQQAIAQHQSQLDPDIFDDDDGFILKEEVLENFYGDREYYITAQSHYGKADYQ